MEPAVLQLLGNRTGPGAVPWLLLAPEPLSGCWGAGGSLCAGDAGVGSSLHMWWMSTRTRPVSSSCSLAWMGLPVLLCPVLKTVSCLFRKTLACPPLALPLGRAGETFHSGPWPRTEAFLSQRGSFQVFPLKGEVGWSRGSGVHPCLG